MAVKAKARAAAREAAAVASRLPKPLRIVRSHKRLFSSIGIGIAVYVAERLQWPETFRATQVLVAWDTGVLVYLVAATILISRFDLTLARQRAEEQDEGGLALLVLTVAAAVASLGAIVAQLGSITPDADRGPYFALAVATITLSWSFIQVIFSLHYAHEFYDTGDEGGGLQFPEDDHPEYWDFLYFSVVIGMTFQVSDVQVTSKRMRRLVAAHGVLAFAFNVAILALVVNLGANLINS
jgi:uncharacterized membrane protein